MLIKTRYHLTYCTNIHSEKSWKDLFEGLGNSIPQIKEKVSPGQAFGIGLRLSDFTSRELLEGKNLMKFKTWLDENNLYVFTMNGFPYGIFHNKAVKDDVHKPDWTTQERVEYTKRLCRVLAVLLPQNMEGGISTSPVSYKPWFENQKEIEYTFKKGALHLAVIVEELLKIKKETGKVLHIDIEPEPDGLLESSDEVISFFNNYLLPEGIDFLIQHLPISPSQAEEAIKNHIRVCYDICHFAVGYENHQEAMEKFEKAGIKIGKIQISSALKANFQGDEEQSNDLLKEFEKLNDPVYLHQVIQKENNSSTIIQYRDLPKALADSDHKMEKEWRVHFHVPLFVERYGKLNSTQDDVLDVMQILNKKRVTEHLEVETYTWEILPEDLKIDLNESISRELDWVLNNIH